MLKASRPTQKVLVVKCGQIRRVAQSPTRLPGPGGKNRWNSEKLPEYSAKWDCRNFKFLECLLYVYIYIYIIIINIIYLVGGLEHFFHILGIIIPTDEVIFFKGVQTTNHILYTARWSFHTAKFGPETGSIWVKVRTRPCNGWISIDFYPFTQYIPNTTYIYIIYMVSTRVPVLRIQYIYILILIYIFIIYIYTVDLQSLVLELDVRWRSNTWWY